MATDRSKCQISPDVLKQLLKKHVNNLDNGLWKSDEDEDVVVNYNALLCAWAQHTPRLNPSLLKKIVKGEYGVTDKVAQGFAQALANALSYCFTKGQKAISGKKLSDDVKRVVMNFYDPKMQAIQKILKQEAMTTKSSKAASPQVQGSSGSSGSSSACLPVCYSSPATPIQVPADPDDEERRIWKLYGFSPPVKKSGKQNPQQKMPESTDIISSQEILSSQDVPAQPAPVHEEPESESPKKKQRTEEVRV